MKFHHNVVPVVAQKFSEPSDMHSMKMPLTIFKNKNGEVKYVTHQKVTEIIRKAVKFF